jgi:hypothetical protein
LFVTVSQLLYTVEAHKFLSAIVIQVFQSQLILISHNVLLWNIQALPVQAYNVFQLLSGITGLFLNGRIEQASARLNESYAHHIDPLVKYIVYAELELSCQVAVQYLQ